MELYQLQLKTTSAHHREGRKRVKYTLAPLVEKEKEEASL